MKTTPLTALQPALLALRSRWASLSERERRLVLLAGAALALLLLWWLWLQPVWRTWRQVPAQIRALEAQALVMQRQAGEAAELKGQPAVSTTQAGAAVKAAADRFGARMQPIIMGERATLTLNQITPDELRQWLTEVRQAARSRVVEAQLTRAEDGLSGKLVLALPASP